MSHPHQRISCFLLTAVALTAGTVRADGLEAYSLDPVHTRVMFAVEHAGFSQALGTVSGSTGSLLFDPDDWRSARLDVSVPLTRLELGDAKWNAATLGASLLDGERYPLARFVSSSVEVIDMPVADLSQQSPTHEGRSQSGTAHEERAPTDQTQPELAQSAGTQARVCGELTLRDVTRPLCMDVTFNALKRYPLPPFRRTAGFSATATLSRSEFGIDAWASVIGDRVELRIEAEATRDSSAGDMFLGAPEPSTTTERAALVDETRDSDPPADQLQEEAPREETSPEEPPASSADRAVP